MKNHKDNDFQIAFLQFRKEEISLFRKKSSFKKLMKHSNYFKFAKLVYFYLNEYK